MVDKRGLIISDNSIQLFDDSFCYFCGFPGTQEHHIIRRCDGGKDEQSNLIPLCKSCHKLIHSRKFLIQYSKGYLLLVNRENPEIKVFPNMRQTNKLRDCPWDSINKAVQLGRLRVE